MPITDKLNAIITKLSDGATKPIGQTIEEKLDIIDSLIGAGGGGGSSGDIFFITKVLGTIDEYGTGLVGTTLDKTAAEIIAAVEAGKIVLLELDYSYSETEDGTGIPMTGSTYFYRVAGKVDYGTYDGAFDGLTVYFSNAFDVTSMNATVYKASTLSDYPAFSND